jgi:hypothetical protein
MKSALNFNNERPLLFEYGRARRVIVSSIPAVDMRG